MITRREILATINATTRETGYERVLAGDFLAAIQTDNIDALNAALHDLAGVALTSWTFTLAVHAICGTTIKRHTVGPSPRMTLLGSPPAATDTAGVWSCFGLRGPCQPLPDVVRKVVLVRHHTPAPRQLA